MVGNRNMMSTVMHWYLVVDVCSVDWNSSVCIFGQGVMKLILLDVYHQHDVY